MTDSLQTVIAAALKASGQPEGEKHRIYAALKRRIERTCATPHDYERAIKQLCDALRY